MLVAVMPLASVIVTVPENEHPLNVPASVQLMLGLQPERPEPVIFPVLRS